MSNSQESIDTVFTLKLFSRPKPHHHTVSGWSHFAEKQRCSLQETAGCSVHMNAAITVKTMRKSRLTRGLRAPWRPTGKSPKSISHSVIWLEFPKQTCLNRWDVTHQAGGMLEKGQDLYVCECVKVIVSEWAYEPYTSGKKTGKKK